MLAILGQSGSGGGDIAAIISILAVVAIIVLTLVGWWKMFAKAGQPGWTCIIPFVNVYILLKIVGRPGWWLLLFFLPIISFIVFIVVMIDLAKSFGKGSLFAVGLVLLSVVFIPVLGLGKSEYQGPAAA